MEEYLKAGVFFHGSSVRYTEIVESGTDPALLKRLGSCRFDFPVSEALVGGNPELLATLHEALIDVFDGSRLHEVCLAIDPSICLTFQTAIAAAMFAYLLSGTVGTIVFARKRSIRWSARSSIDSPNQTMWGRIGLRLPALRQSSHSGTSPSA